MATSRASQSKCSAASGRRPPSMAAAIGLASVRTRANAAPRPPAARRLPRRRRRGCWHPPAQVTGLDAGEFVHTLGDAHLYRNHRKQAWLQLLRPPRPLPTMTLNPSVTDLFAFRYEDFSLETCAPHPHIEAEVAV